MLALAGLVVGVVTGFFAGAAERGLYATGLWSTGGASTIAPGVFDDPSGAGGTTTPSVPAGSDLPSPLLAPASPARTSSAAEVAERIEAVDDNDVGGRYGAEVVALGSGRVLFSHRDQTPVIPASTLKLLTSAAALSRLGPDHEFVTTVVRAARGRIVLVGGGDPYLTRAGRPGPRRASLAALAQTAAAELRRTGTTRVALDYDASRFSGPAWNPTWPTAYADQVTPVSALWVDEGRVAGYSPGPRVSDPAREAARAFATALQRRGVSVTAVRAARAPRSATRIAAVSSPPLEQIVEQLLLTSDNDAAEVLLRQVALASGRAGTSADGARAVRAQLSRLRLWDDDAVVLDGSGLSRSNRLPADLLVRLLRTAASPSHPELRPLLTGLPVAGVEGSLRVRYGDPESRAGRGVVRGKTGTLSKVHAVAGYLRTADGEQVAFAFLVNDATNDYAARVWLDRVTTALSRCGC